MIFRLGLVCGMLTCCCCLVGTAQIPVDDTGPLDRHDVENVHVPGLLDQSNFRFVGRSNPHGPFTLSARNWTDLYGYAYDGNDPQWAGRQFAYVTTGGFSPRDGFFEQHMGGIAIFEVTNDADPVYYGTILPECTAASCSFLFRDAEIHDGVAYFSSDRGPGTSGGVVAYDLRIDPTNPRQIAHLNRGSVRGLNAVHEIGLDVVGPGEAYLYANDSESSGRVAVYDVGDARNGIAKVADILGVSTHGAFADDGILYVTGDSHVTVFDVSDIGNANFTQLGQFVAPGGFTHSSWSDTYTDASGQQRNVLYVTHEMDGTDLQVWDVTDIIDQTTPPAAELIASISNLDLANEQGTGSVTNVHNVFLAGDTLFTSWTVGGMVVVDVADPTNPRVTDTFDTTSVEGSSNFAGAFGVNPSLGLDRVLISDRATGLWVVDTTTLIPEPATGGGSLLALVGWAAQRRRRWQLARSEPTRDRR